MSDSQELKEASEYTLGTLESIIKEFEREATSYINEYIVQEVSNNNEFFKPLKEIKKYRPALSKLEQERQEQEKKKQEQKENLFGKTNEQKEEIKAKEEQINIEKKKRIKLTKNNLENKPSTYKPGEKNDK